MANQTLTNVSLNHDSAAISGLLNGETYTIDNSTLIYDCDVRWGQHAVVPGATTINSATGGTIKIDSTKVWEIPFSASTGNSPTLTTLGSNLVTGLTSGATAEMFRVWDNTALAPIAQGTAMPAAGWIKLRYKTGNFLSGETITLPGGATIVAANVGKRSWIHVVAKESASESIPRLGKFLVTGDWYYLGTTNGADDQQFKFPVADSCPAIQIETSPGSGIYAWWPNAGDKWGTIYSHVATDARGTFFGMDNTTGIITIARRSSNACGMKPPSGCLVRIPNAILSSAAATNYALNSVNATATTRHTFSTTASGFISVDKASMNWYGQWQTPYYVSCTNSSFLHQILISNTASDTIITGCAVGCDNSGLITSPVTALNLFTNLTMNNNFFVRQAAIATNAVCISLTDVINFNLDDNKIFTFGGATTASKPAALSAAYSLLRCFGGTINRNSTIGGSITMSTCSNAVIKDTTFASEANGSTVVLGGIFAFVVSAGSSNIVFDGFSNFASIPDVHPYLGFLITATNVSGITLQNIGTPSNLYDCGSALQLGLIISATVTLNMILRRIYVKNTRGAASILSIANTVQNVTIENVWVDYSDVNVIAGNNVISRGNKWSISNVAQTASYARQWEDAFSSDTTGAIALIFSEPLAINQIYTTETFGASSGFTSSGAVSMVSLGDELTIETPYFIKNYTGFANIAKIFATGTGIQNHNYYYQLDKGIGYESQKTLFSCRIRSSGGTIATNTFVITPVAGVIPAVGDYVGTFLGTHFSPGTTVTAYNNTTGAVTVSNNILVTLSASLEIYFFKSIVNETGIDPNTGVKLKIKVSTSVASSLNSLKNIMVSTITSLTNQTIQYPLPGIPMTITGLVSGSEVRAYVGTDPSTAVQIDGVETSSTSFVFSHNNATQAGFIVIFGIGYAPMRIPVTYSASPVEIPVQQVIDRVYANA